MDIDTATGKRDIIHAYLASNVKVAGWYATEHGVTADDFTAANVNVYGSGPDAMGDLADLIISDAVFDGFIADDTDE